MEIVIFIYFVGWLTTAFFIFNNDRELLYTSTYIFHILFLGLFCWWVFWIFVTIKYFQEERFKNL